MADFESRWAKLNFGKSQRIRVYKQLAKLIRNSVQTRTALDTVWNRASQNGKNPNHPVAIIIDEWRMAYKNGKPLGQAMIGWIPANEQMLVEAGEVGGALEDALMKVIDQSQNSGKMIGAMVGGLAYPIVLFLVTLGMMWGFGTNIVPAFASVADPERWTGVAHQMYAMSKIVRIWTIPALVLVGVAGTLYMSTVSIWTGDLRAKFDRIPPWSMYRLWQGSSFLMALSALIGAGVSLTEALRKLMKHANPYLRERIESTLFHANTGANLGQALDRTHLDFPDREIVADLKIYAELAQFEQALEEISRDWLSEGVDAVRRQSSIMRTVIMIVMGFVISWMAWGMFQMQEQVTEIARHF